MLLHVIVITNCFYVIILNSVFCIFLGFITVWCMCIKVFKKELVWAMDKWLQFTIILYHNDL